MLFFLKEMDCKFVLILTYRNNVQLKRESKHSFVSCCHYFVHVPSFSGHRWGLGHVHIAV